ncbi:MAG: hypothetical protein KDA78_09270 [Planctomycetaceae bacterium]|nr:hypothetical protein [Planctomycetaceae bacterium]
MLRNFLRLTTFSLAICFAISATTATAQAADDGRLAAIGGLSAAHMYTTYIAIGATADAFGNDVYETKQVQDIMGGMVGMIDTLKKQLLLVQENCEDPSDKDYIDETIQVYNLLQEEARQLSTFAKTRDVADHRAYEKARTTVWPRIEKLLGIDD